MKKIVSMALALMLLLSSASVSFAAESYNSFGAYEHVFIIGIDGAGAAFSKIDSPNFDRIFADNAYTHESVTEYVTISANNWGSILTGVDYETHGFTNENTDYKQPQRGSDTPNNTIFYYVRQADPKAKLVSASHWMNINHGIIENDLGVKKIWRQSDPMIVDEVVSNIQSFNVPKLMFVQLDDADHAAHTYGGYSDEYYDAIKTMDKNLGTIYDAIEAKGLMKNSLFIVVADHGENENGHGGQSRDESVAVLAVAGHSVNKTQLGEGVHNRDVSAIALYALGIEKPEHFISQVPDGLFGESREKTVAENPAPAEDKMQQLFVTLFVRFVNIIVGLFDFIEI